MLSNRVTLRGAWKDLGVFLLVGLMSSLVLALAASFLKVYEDSMRVRQRSRLAASIVQEQGNLLFHEQAGTVSFTPTPESVSGYMEAIPLRRWVIEKFAETNRDPRAVSKDVEKMLSRSKNSPQLMASLKRWQATLDRWSAGFSSARDGLQSSRALTLLLEGRQHYFESAGFRRIGKSFDGTILDLWTITVLSKFVEKYPLHPAVPEALFMLGDEYFSLGQALPDNTKSARILNLVSELYPDSVWASRANAVWKSGHAHAI
jgi:hypothetical protein